MNQSKFLENKQDRKTIGQIKREGGCNQSIKQETATFQQIPMEPKGSSEGLP